MELIDFSQVERILTFFAHPDDEVLAAGGTIHKLSQRTEIHVAIPATGIHSRRNHQGQAERDQDLIKLRADCRKALSGLGIRPDRIYLGNFADNEMDRGTLLEVVHWLENLIETIQPQIILTHHRYCTNVDHQYCHEAAVVATRPGVDRHITLISGEVPSSTGYLRPAQWEPNFYISLDEADIAAKVEAMERYEGEARKDPHPRSPESLWALAKVRGSESGFYYAESFMINRVFEV